MKREKAADPFQPLKRSDSLSSVEVLSLTADPYDKRAIVACRFKRANSDIARAADGYSAGETSYVKIGRAPFSFHTDAPRPLWFHDMTDLRKETFGAWLKLGITHLRVSGISTEHGSESMKRKGVEIQVLTVEAGGFRLHEHAFPGLMSTFWEAHNAYNQLISRPVHVVLESDFRWHDSPIIWCGVTADEIRADQAQAAQLLAERATIRAQHESGNESEGA